MFVVLIYRTDGLVFFTMLLVNMSGMMVSALMGHLQQQREESRSLWRVPRQWMPWERLLWTRDGWKVWFSMYGSSKLWQQNYTIFVIHQCPVVQRVDNAIHPINHYPVDSVVCFVNTKFIHWIAIYPADSVIHPLNNWAQKYKMY